MEGEDLGALFARVTRRLIEAERPLLAELGLSMWQYIVLTELSRRDANTQQDLAESIGYDKTRLIGLLDELERRGLLTREADPVDRRARVVRLTRAGRVVRGAARDDIRAMEDELLGGLRDDEREMLRDVLPRLAAPGG